MINLKASMLRAFPLGAALLASTNLSAAPVKHLAIGAVLWSKVRANMTETQLRAVLPGVQFDPKAEVFHAPDAVVAGQHFKVSIEMVNAIVARVTLSSGDALVDPIKELLNAKYGSPSEQYDCRWMAALRRCGGVWHAPQNVLVSLSNTVFEGGSITSIKYSAADTSEI